MLLAVGCTKEEWVNGIRLEVEGMDMNGDSILCVLPLPITNEATDFTFEATYMTSYPPRSFSRTMRGMKVKRSHMYLLPTFELEPNTEKKA